MASAMVRKLLYSEFDKEVLPRAQEADAAEKADPKGKVERIYNDKADSYPQHVG